MAEPDIFLPDFYQFLAEGVPDFREYVGLRFRRVTFFQRLCTPININGVSRGLPCIQSV